MDTFRSPIALLLVAFFGFAARVAAENDEGGAGEVAQWRLSEDLVGEALGQNPSPGQSLFPAEWHFLRTTRSEGPIETRKWLRDGRYEPLAVHSSGQFGWPSEWWLFRDDSPPAIGRLLESHSPGLTFEPGDIGIGTGPDHAVVIGWQSPVAGRLEIEGAFEHAENCCGTNGQINWYVERGPRPDVEHGFEPRTLATGRSAFESDSASGTFHIRDEIIESGDFIYFIADARADGTSHPHHGDGTRFDVTLTVHGAKFPPPPSFEKDILPILAARCHGCHGDTPEAQLDLRTLSEILRGGENGPAVVPGDPAASLLVDIIVRGQMPPDDAEKVTAAELRLIRQWVAGKTPAEEKVVSLPLRSHVTDEDRQFWAFQSPRKTPLPSVTHTDRVHNPIDAFLLEKLESKALSFAPDADRRTMIRRASFDLLGLPPSPREVESYVSDARPDAYERLIERLLGSQRYGERWARHWLDAAGFSDTNWDGDAATLYLNPGLWKYRNYVIRAFNDNRPIDRFITEQLAGDELIDWRSVAEYTDKHRELLVATGYLRAMEDHTDDPQYGVEKKYDVLFAAMETFSSSMLGLTMDCCRCHSHKYDPLPQRDYYRLMAFFESTFNVQHWINRSERMLPDVPASKKSEIDATNAALDQQNAEQQKSIDRARESCRKRLFTERLTTIPEALRDDVKLAFETAADKRSDEQKLLVAQHESTMAISDEQIAAALTAEERGLIALVEKKQAELNAQRRSYGHIMALWDMGEPPASRVMRRGNVYTPGVLVQPGYPEVLQPALESGSQTLTSAPVGKTSGRRLALARWVTAPGHPLTARVFVNRVWHHHFGRGIVTTPGNFGRSGAPPSHPELLDWLAVDFQQSGWDLKRLHKLIMTSTAYQQAYHTTGALQQRAQDVDADNHLLWRSNLRRLDAEIVRDSVLAVSGAIDLTAGGAPVMFHTPTDGLSTTNSTRRSIYLLARRVYPLKFLEVFDAPIIPVTCPKRVMSATVLQSLAQLNSEFLFASAERLADRIMSEASEPSKARIRRAFELAFARHPGEAELERSLAFLKAQRDNHIAAQIEVGKATRMALADFCHMLMSTNEFLYLE